MAGQLRGLIHLDSDEASFGDVLSKTLDSQIKFGRLYAGLLNLNCFTVGWVQTSFNAIFISVIRPEVSSTLNLPGDFTAQENIEGGTVEHCVERSKFLSQLVN